MAGMTQNTMINSLFSLWSLKLEQIGNGNDDTKQADMTYSYCGPSGQSRKTKQIQLNQLAIEKTLNLLEVNT